MRRIGLRRLVYAIILLLIFGGLGFTLYQYRQDFIDFPWKVHAPTLVASLIFHALALWVTYFVWYLMIRSLDGFDDSWLTIRFYFLSTLAKRIPTSLPYIGSRIVLYRQVAVPESAVLNAVFFETLLIGIAGVFFLVCLLPFFQTGFSPPWTITLVGSSFLAFFLLIHRTDRLIHWGNKLFRKMKLAPTERVPHPREIFRWTLLYTLPWLFAGISLKMAIWGLTGIDLPWSTAMGISTLATLVSLLNLVLPGGFGLKEVTMAALLSVWLPLPVAIIFSLLYRMLHTINELLWAVLALLIPSPKNLELPPALAPKN